MATADPIAETVDDTVKGCFGSLLIFMTTSGILSLGLLIIVFKI